MNQLIIVRGGGDLATGIIHKLTSAGFRVLILECASPSAIRRQVSFCEAVYESSACVEGLTAVKIVALTEMEEVFQKGQIPLLVDPDAESAALLKPDILIDAIIAKRNLGTHMDMAPLTIGVGPGFTAGTDTHLVIETKRGHNLGRIIKEGRAAENTGIPGMIGGYAKERVIHSPAAGIMHTICHITDLVEKDQMIAEVLTETGEQIPVAASIPGIIRGLIRDGYPVSKGFKIADIDPRIEELSNCRTISDKSRCIAGGVLEAVCCFYSHNHSGKGFQ